MTDQLSRLVGGKASRLGIILGLVYGLAARLATGFSLFGDAFAVMSIAFLVVVPIVLGHLTVSTVERPSWAYRIFAPWVPTLLVVVFAIVLGWEGAICIVMALPLILFFASLGGISGAASAASRPGVRPALLVLPLLVGPLERSLGTPTRFTETVTEVRIARPPAAVWPLVASVDSIRPEERRPALFVTLGFPRPVSATISGAGVGAVRRARFERGLVFTETVTDWEPARRLRFTIRPNTDAIPPTTLDQHVTIGGPFFDVLTGTYELYPTDGGRGTRLVLRSEHRLSTRLNPYAAWWVDRVMSSIQENILAVHKARAERGDPAAYTH
jgi:uncharacterized protein YndB with AHSA1/START domain